MRPSKLSAADVETWLAAHPGWQKRGDALTREYKFADFAGAMAFAVRVGMLAERRDHHPDLEVGWGRVSVRWTTHDAGGITPLDLTLAEGTDGAAS